MIVEKVLWTSSEIDFSFPFGTRSSRDIDLSSRTLAVKLSCVGTRK